MEHAEVTALLNEIEQAIDKAHWSKKSASFGLPSSWSAYEAVESGWKLLALKTHNGRPDGTAIAIGKALVVRLTPELAARAVAAAQAHQEGK